MLVTSQKTNFSQKTEGKIFLPALDKELKAHTETFEEIQQSQNRARENAPRNGSGHCSPQNEASAEREQIFQVQVKGLEAQLREREKGILLKDCLDV